MHVLLRGCQKKTNQNVLKIILLLNHLWHGTCICEMYRRHYNTYYWEMSEANVLGVF